MAVLILLSIPSNRLPFPDVPNIDKLAHTAIYGALMILWCLAVRFQWPAWRLGLTLLVIGCVVTLYGVYGEFHQRFFAGRNFSVWDMVFDGLGALLGGIFWWWWEGRRDRKVRSGQRAHTGTGPGSEEPASPL